MSPAVDHLVLECPAGLVEIHAPPTTIRRKPKLAADAVARATRAARLVLSPPTALDRGEQARLLRELSDDPDVLVRAALAQAMKVSLTAPRDLVLRLARDREAAVSVPILQASPILDDAALIEFVRDPSGAATVSTIAARPRIGADLSAAIIATEDVDAISTLLGNALAIIDDATLQTLVESARRHASWQALLAMRPVLSCDAAMALGTYLTGDPLAALAARTDLPSHTTNALLEQVLRRLGSATPAGEDAIGAFERAKVLHAGRMLSDGLVQQAALREEDHFVIAALKILSGVADHVIDRVRDRQDPHALAALAGRAGLGIACTQAVVAVLTPSLRRLAGPEPRDRQRYVRVPAT